MFFVVIYKKKIEGEMNFVLIYKKKIEEESEKESENDINSKSC